MSLPGALVDGFLAATGLRDLFATDTPNPDLIGRVAVTREDIEPDRLEKLEAKRRRARQYLTDRHIEVRPICRTLPKE